MINVDRLLSRFKIQTKVLVFIVPFIFSIAAVGFVGFYASGLLQSRLTISSGMMTSLSGFREVTAAMTRFLNETVEENYSDVTERLAQQTDILKNTLTGLEDGAEGVDYLNSAAQSAVDVEGGMSNLWALHEEEVVLRNKIDESLRAMIASQLLIDDQLSTIERDLQVQEGTVKNGLFAAGRMSSNGHALTAIYDEYAALKAPEEKLDYLKSALKNSNRLVRKLKVALPLDQKPLVEKLQKAFASAKATTDQGMVGNMAVMMLVPALSQVKNVADEVKAMSVPVMEQSLAALAKLEPEKIRMASTIGDSRKVSKSIALIQIELAKFLATPNTKNRDSLIQVFQIVDKDMEALAGSAKGEEFFEKLKATITPALESMTADSEALVHVAERRISDFNAAAEQIDVIWSNLTAFAEVQKVSAGVERERTNTISIGATALGIVISVLAAIGLVTTFKGPIGRITAAMRKLADGTLDASIDGSGRVDEIGDMARALDVFKENALEKIRVEKASEEQRLVAEQERVRNDAERQANEEQIAFAVEALANGLARLSEGDLTETIETPFTGSLEKLRTDFNGSLERLRETLTNIKVNAQGIHENGVAMQNSADELSRRTEGQAASLEETAAAVDEITVTVRNAADRAREANSIVGKARESAESSAGVVANAVGSMARIEEASKKIEQIIDVIEDIAFQTNLLALNAGVEAARAGDAGKGFAVVAQEVRELAQRSAGAAHEIKGLIETATSEVSSGVVHVKETGTVLTAISTQISEISDHVNVIATGAQDQASGLQEVNSSVNQMDQMTQANAAMAEESNALSQRLAHEAGELMQLVDRFNLQRSGAGQYRSVA